MTGSRPPRAAFDAVAEAYDATMENNPVTARIRPVFWESLFRRFIPGDRVLELNCGTGTDAIKLAERGIHVTATDASPLMIEEARRKVVAHGLEKFITLRTMEFEALNALPDASFDGVFSNFGGLNCADRLPPVIEQVAAAVKPGRAFIACLLNRFSLWEMAGFAARGNLRQARRRFRSTPIGAAIGGRSVTIRYYSPQQVSGMMRPWFLTEEIYGLSIVSPSPNSRAFAEHHPALTERLLRLDARIRSLYPFCALGDHFTIVGLRRPS